MSILKSIKGLFGQTIHYKDGVKVGETWDGLLPGTKNHYDANGRFSGSSSPGFFADQVHYDEHGNRLGESWTDAFGTTRHYDENGRAGTSYDSLFSTTSNLHDDANLFPNTYDQIDSFDTDRFSDDLFSEDSDW